MSKQVQSKKCFTVKNEQADDDGNVPLKFDFKAWAEESQLMEKTVHILLEQDVNVIDALLMLNESDIKELDLTVGQQKLLSKRINRARGSHLPKLQVEQTKDLIIASLSKEKDLHSILNKLESSGSL